MKPKFVLPAHGLEHGHIPAPAGHAPRLAVTFTRAGLCVHEEGNPDTYLLAKDPVEIQR